MTIVLIVLSVNFFLFSSSQASTADSLNNYSFNELKTLFFENMHTMPMAKIYADAHLKKAKIDKNPLKIAEGYLLTSYVSDFESAIEYSDSIIKITSHLGDYQYPTLGYMAKGYHYYNEGNESKALDLYLEAYENAKASKNQNLQIEIKQFIGGIKYNFGNYDEALETFKDQLNLIKNQTNFKEDYYTDYIIVLDDISKTYLRGGQPDSALIYVNEGIKNCFKDDNKEMYNRFLLTSGSSFYFLKQYDRALDSLNKLEPTIKDSTRLAMCLYYRGKVYESKNLNDQAIKDFKRIDSIYQNNKFSFIELREVYKSLFNYYSRQGSETEQLNSIKKLILIDSLLDKNFKYTNNKIIKDFDVPKLKNEKKNLELIIVDNARKNKVYLFVFIVVLLLILYLTLKFYYTQRSYKKRFDEIIIEATHNNNVTDKNKTKLAPINKIPDHVISEIISKLSSFEENHKYLNNNLSLNRLSKQLDTNSTYLSKIINSHKGQSFSSYINGLRINYIINELKRNSTLRNYTIMAIAEEAGYNNAESFSKAFFKEKGIYPSYFIKQLKKNK